MFVFFGVLLLDDVDAVKRSGVWWAIWTTAFVVMTISFLVYGVLAYRQHRASKRAPAGPGGS